MTINITIIIITIIPVKPQHLFNDVVILNENPRIVHVRVRVHVGSSSSVDIPPQRRRA